MTVRVASPSDRAGEKIEYRVAGSQLRTADWRGARLSTGGSTTIDLQRPKSVREVIGDAVRCYGLYPGLFAQITLAVVVPYALIVSLLDGRGLLGQSDRGISAALLVTVLDLLLVGPLISALHVNALVEIAEGRRPRLGAVLAKGTRVLAVVAAAQIVASLGIAAGFLLVIIPGLFLLARWAVVAQIAALEGVNWIGALRRSGELTAGAYMHVLGLLISVAIINQVIERIGASLAGPGGSVAQLVVGVGIETITLSFAALTTAMLYFDLQARKR